jgi:hypothetical protein
MSDAALAGQWRETGDPFVAVFDLCGDERCCICCRLCPGCIRCDAGLKRRWICMHVHCYEVSDGFLNNSLRLHEYTLLCTERVSLRRPTHVFLDVAGSAHSLHFKYFCDCLSSIFVRGSKQSCGRSGVPREGSWSCPGLHRCAFAHHRSLSLLILSQCGVAGVKLILEFVGYDISALTSLGVVVSVLGAGVVASKMKAQEQD